jgi:hypothetical protein
MLHRNGQLSSGLEWVKGGHGIDALATSLVPRIAAQVIALGRSSASCQKQTAHLARYPDDGRVIGRTSRMYAASAAQKFSA